MINYGGHTNRPLDARIAICPMNRANVFYDALARRFIVTALIRGQIQSYGLGLSFLKFLSTAPSGHVERNVSKLKTRRGTVQSKPHNQRPSKFKSWPQVLLDEQMGDRSVSAAQSSAIDLQIRILFSERKEYTSAFGEAPAKYSRIGINIGNWNYPQSQFNSTRIYFNSKSLKLNTMFRFTRGPGTWLPRWEYRKKLTFPGLGGSLLKDFGPVVVFVSPVVKHLVVSVERRGWSFPTLAFGHLSSSCREMVLRGILVPFGSFDFLICVYKFAVLMSAYRLITTWQFMFRKIILID